MSGDEMDLAFGDAPPDPEELEATGVTRPFEISASMTLGPVHLTVSELGRSLDYYRQAIGLELLEEGAGQASLGVADRQLIVLVEEPGAAPSHGHTGLYHFALLLPSRADLARWLVHAARDAVPLVGLSDHFVSEALYLSDPDEHGIEIYWDRPRELWEGMVATRLTTLPLDVEDLVGEIGDPATEPFPGLPRGTTMGHVHLKVAAIPDTVAFYRDVLGFELMAQLGRQAAFLSAGGYHHHIGANTWESAGATPAPPGTAALRHATILLPNTAERDRVIDRLEKNGYHAQDPLQNSDGRQIIHDPSGNALLIAIG